MERPTRFPFSSNGNSQLSDSPKEQSLVDVDWLHAHLDDESVRIVDCPWDHAAYGRAHIPGAVARPGHPYLKARNSDGSNTVHVAGAETLEKACVEMGIGPDTDVVLYDAWGSLFATRLWWALRYYGFRNVRVLDGGWQAWVDAGHPVSFRVADARETSRPTLTPDPSRIATLEELVKRHAEEDYQLLDVRTHDEFSGRADRGNRRAGKIPGSIHLEWNRFLENSTDTTAVRRLRGREELRAMIEEAGVDSSKIVVTHCQAGIRATLSAFVLEWLGFPDVRVYDGSMEEWANREDTPLV
jgi:thiosulfate/3-mercaptopyruvate sulfurtransferase